MAKNIYAVKRLQIKTGVWSWSVNFSRNGTVYSKRFYDSTHGGSAKALKAAIAWRDAKLTKIKAMTLVDFCEKPRSNSKSKVTGVHFLTSPRQPKGIWQAKLKLAGKSKSRSFSVLQFGSARAFELAVAARQQLLADARGVSDRPYLYSATAKRFARHSGG